MAIGGDLLPDRILSAYEQGVFPWFEPGCPILWWSPNPRLILEPDSFKLSTSLKKSLKKPYQITMDEAFEEVIQACATVNGRLNNTWISSGMQAAYTELHHRGFAHSIELWSDNRLVGGLYGISLGRAFFGESMFHRERDTSKITLYYLCEIMKDWSFELIDCQLPNPYLQDLGAHLINRQDFLYRLKSALAHPTRQRRWIFGEK